MMWASIIAAIVELLIKLGLKKKQESDAQKAKALEKTVESVSKSIEVEKTIRDEQKAVEKAPSKVEDKDGGLNFDDFNKGK